MSIRNIVGHAVSGDDFFRRPSEVEKIRKLIQSDCNLLLSAPRRVGKTSILFHLSDVFQNEYVFIYVITEAVSSLQEFFARLIESLVMPDGLYHKTNRELLPKAFREKLPLLKSVKLLDGDLVFDKSNKNNLISDFSAIAKSLELGGKKCVLMIDEYPQAVANIEKNQGREAALQFLRVSRELRHDRMLMEKVKFILTGSIGLENIVTRLEGTHLITDLTYVTVNPFDVDEAGNFLNELCLGENINLDRPVIEALLESVKWNIPFYLQIIFQELMLYKESIGRDIKCSDVDLIVNKVLERRTYFDHWHSRLKRSFNNRDYLLAEEILNKIAKHGEIASNSKLFVSDRGRKKKNKVREVLSILIHDGYIHKNPEFGTYAFNSPLLKIWWYRNVTT